MKYYFLLQQFDYFGNHGFAGDIKLDYDVDVSGGTQLVTKDGYFASDANVRKCVEHLRGSADTLWFLAPCAGRSARLSL